MMFAQTIPDPTQVITRATGISWEAGMVAFIMVVFLTVIIYMIKRQNDQMEAERGVHKAREERMAKRIDQLEDLMHQLEAKHTGEIVAMVKDMTACIVGAGEAQAEVAASLRTLITTMNGVNGDIKELCQLIRLSPCLVAEIGRDGYRLLDRDGKEIKLSKGGA